MPLKNALFLILAILSFAFNFMKYKITQTFLMKFQVTEIEFDFDDCPYCGENQSPEHDAECDGFVEVFHIKNETIGQIWDADDEEDLVEEITCATGWCIKSIDYVHVLS